MEVEKIMKIIITLKSGDGEIFEDKNDLVAKNEAFMRIRYFLYNCIDFKVSIKKEEKNAKYRRHK